MLDARNGLVRFRRLRETERRPVPEEFPVAHTSVVLPDPDFVLVGCVKGKRDGRHPAASLFTSALFRGRRARAEETGRPWFVLSSKYGVVAPDEVIETYDVALKALPVPQRQQCAYMDGCLGVYADPQGVLICICQRIQASDVLEDGVGLSGFF